MRQWWTSAWIWHDCGTFQPPIFDVVSVRSRFPPILTPALSSLLCYDFFIAVAFNVWLACSSSPCWQFDTDAWNEYWAFPVRWQTFSSMSSGWAQEKRAYSGHLTKLVSEKLLACANGMQSVVTVVWGGFGLALGAKSSRISIARRILMRFNVLLRGMLQASAVFAAVIEFAGSIAVVEPRRRQTWLFDQFKYTWLMLNTINCLF